MSALRSGCGFAALCFMWARDHRKNPALPQRPLSHHFFVRWVRWVHWLFDWPPFLSDNHAMTIERLKPHPEKSLARNPLKLKLNQTKSSLIKAYQGRHDILSNYEQI